MVLIHEAGHALAAVALRHRVEELSVGDDEPVLAMRVGGFRINLGAITGRGDVAGFVRYDGAGVSPRDWLVIAMAGPLASLAGAVVTGMAIAWAWPSVGLTLILSSAALTGLAQCVGNLMVTGDGPESWSDGACVRAAWREMRTPLAPAADWSDPREATSIPPPPR